MSVPPSIILTTKDVLVILFFFFILEKSIWYYPKNKLIRTCLVLCVSLFITKNPSENIKEESANWRREESFSSTKYKIKYKKFCVYPGKFLWKPINRFSRYNEKTDLFFSVRFFRLPLVYEFSSPFNGKK